MSKIRQNLLKIISKKRRCLTLTIVVSILGIGVVSYCRNQQGSVTPQISNYEIYRQIPIAQPNYYPLDRQYAANLYQPVGLWTGRLILPENRSPNSSRFVLFEVYNAPDNAKDLIGKVVKLQWSDRPDVKDYRQLVTRDIRFAEKTIKSQRVGNLHPDRLNNKKAIDPLESLAGARPDDNVIVRLQEPISLLQDGKQPILKIDREPVQITGRVYGLVNIVKREANGDRGDRFLVRHFNKGSKQFDGELETIRIPQVIADRSSIPKSTNRDIEKSPLNPTGWYIYGAKDANGIFVVQAIEPRALMRLQPNEVRLNQQDAIAYIDEELWKNTAAQKGTAKVILLDPNSSQPQEAVSRWKEGDRAIVIHIYGGIGGNKAESTTYGIVTGHFAYGIATVVRDPLSGELRFDIEYKQIYAHNPDGIIAGSIEWSGYMGDLQRGWLGNRPVADAIVKLDAVTQDYDFGGIKLSPLDEFTKQLNIMMARYRTGDGTGAAIVSPAASCVQDANQALYITIKRIEAQVGANPQIQAWLKLHPQDSQTLRFDRLVKLGRAIEQNLAPLGIVRSDWQQNAENLAGTSPGGDFISTFLSWRTILPRRAHDEIATIFLQNGASIWILRSNQVGGFDPDIAPEAPTALFGHRTN
ncbi:MAG: CPBP family intramembrane metalloprotease domain-containing protein [Cyanosarcina radialis HA8281-LM2]|nr:CPBP family intramembrane metalloprotease domain-containing protein [Cyanosarcina radialis HA8281-LM2]